MMNTSTRAANSLVNSIANSTTKSLTNAVNSVQTMATNSTSTIASAANSAIGAINSTTTTLGNAINSAATTTLNSIPGMNSLLPMGNGSKKNNSGANNSFFNTANANANRNRNSNVSAENTSSQGSWSWLTSYVSLFLLLVVLSFLLFTAFSNQIELAYKNIVMSVRTALGYPAITVMESDDSENNAITPPESTEDQVSATNPSGPEQSILQKLLPMSSPEVFNVSKNDYSYYDAEPLCRALGAELATYDQVKDAWSKGADWCNYGWVKGQVAVYPTQKDTYNKLQNGPEDEREACGNPGINGGYFDNPEMKFGVNCYGPKPEESAADEAALMKNGTIPKTPASLKVDQKTQEFKDNLSTTTVSPFNSKKWAAS
jgi:hypothetical protein